MERLILFGLESVPVKEIFEGMPAEDAVDQHPKFVALEIDPVISHPETMQEASPALQLAKVIQFCADDLLRQAAELAEDLKLQVFGHAGQFRRAGGREDDLKDIHGSRWWRSRFDVACLGKLDAPTGGHSIGTERENNPLCNPLCAGLTFWRRRLSVARMKTNVLLWLLLTGSLALADACLAQGYGGSARPGGGGAGYRGTSRYGTPATPAQPAAGTRYAQPTQPVQPVQPLPDGAVRFSSLATNATFYFQADANRSFLWIKTSPTTASNTVNQKTATLPATAIVIAEANAGERPATPAPADGGESAAEQRRAFERRYGTPRGGTNGAPARQ